MVPQKSGVIDERVISFFQELKRAEFGIAVKRSEWQGHWTCLKK